MNNQLTRIPSKLLRNKLSKLVTQLQSSSNAQGINSNLKTFESVIAESIKVLNTFYKHLAEPGFAPITIVADTLPDAQTYNETFLGIGNDLEVIFEEFENLEQIIIGDFNYMCSNLNLLNRNLKSIYSKLGDFILFSELPTKDAIFFSDSFNNLNRIETNSPLLNNDQCEINQAEGIITLPIDRKQQKTIPVTDLPIINSNSNGRVGNQEEKGAKLHGNIKDILDNNADTWFEYERLGHDEDGQPLILDFTINLGSPKIINSIQINPNNFGSRTQIEIAAIDTSIDGKDFVSIKDDIPIPGFITVDEDNLFILAPSTSKYSGQGIFTFTPRKAKYVHLTLKQSSTYTITTKTGLKKSRYAIGIRDINIFSLPYKNKGEMISTNFLLNDEVRKVALLSSQNPDAATFSTLASIKHFISPDNGITWYEIRPKVSVGVADEIQTVPEILDFNGVDANTILTASPVLSLRYKAILERNTSAFVEKSASLIQSVAHNTELHTPPSSTPFEITLQNTPIEKTITLIDPQFGSRGKEEVKYNVAVGRGTSLNILLPFKPLKRDLIKVWSTDRYVLEDLDPEKIYVDGNLWTTGLSSSSGTTDEKYRLNYEEGRLIFGDGTNGKAVAVGSRISMTLAEERLFPTQDDLHTAILDYPTSNDKKQMEVYSIDPPQSHTAVLKKGVKRHQLKPDIKPNLAPYEIKFSDITVFGNGNEKPFVDGKTELSGTADYSIDYTNGVLYSKNITSSVNDTTIVYFYTPRTLLSSNQWSFSANDKGIVNAINIADSVFKTHLSSWEDIPDNAKYFNLGNLAIVKGTVEFSATDPTFTTEVPFIDGRSELLGAVATKEALVAITGIGAAPEIYEIFFKMKISSDPSFSVTFDNQSVFQSAKDNLVSVSSVGDYFIDRVGGTTGIIHVMVDQNIESPGSVIYYYDNPQADFTGYYSINYNTGEVFTFNSTPSPSIQIRYKYTNYKARYNIARLVDSDDWSFEASSKKITIKDREILRGIQIPQDAGQSTSSKFYQVVYDYVQDTRANVKELEPFFSPILKEYALKVITRSNLI
jgi:hypothetical protein